MKVYQEATTGRRYNLLKVWTPTGRLTDRTNGRSYDLVKKFI